MAEVLELKAVFEEKMKALLVKVNPRINGNWLTITQTPGIDELTTLRTDLLELNEQNTGVRVKFVLGKVNQRNEQGKYEVTGLSEPITVEAVLSADNFQINRKIVWKDAAGVDRDAVINNFQISVFRGFVETEDLIVESFELAE